MYDFGTLLPIQIDDLIRLGRNYDGGYVLSKSQLDKTKNLLSFGINNDWTFEHDFCKKNPIAEIYGYDYSTITAVTQSIMPSYNAIFENIYKPKIFFFKSFLRIKYYIWTKLHPFNNFFDKSKGKYFFGKFVGTEDKENFVSIDTVFKNIKQTPAPNDLLVKMDIEGAEFSIIPLFKPYFHLINGFIVEFHGLGENGYLTQFNDVLLLLLDSFYIAHTHANNIDIKKGGKWPSCLEITFINKNLISHPIKPSQRKYPLNGLDKKCIPWLPEYKIPF